MSMSKNYGSGCYGYSRRRCGRNNRCGCDDNGVSTGTLLAAGVAASLVALAFSDCTTTTTTTPSATITSEPIAAVVNYYLPGAAGGALATPTNISAASQPLGTIAPQAATAALAAVPVSSTLASLGAGGGVLAAATSGTANIPVVALPIATTTAAVLSTYWQVNLSLAPFVNAATLAGYPTTTIGLTNFFTSGGLTVFADVVTVEIRVGNVNNYFSTGAPADPFASPVIPTPLSILSSAQNARSLATTATSFAGLTSVGVTGAPTTGGASFYNIAAPPAITAITMGTGVATVPTAGTTLNGKISVWATPAIAGVAATPTGAELAAALPTFASYSGIAASGTPTTQQYYRTTFTFNDIITAAVAAAVSPFPTNGSVTKLFAFGMTPQRSNSIATLSTLTQVGAGALTLSYPFDSGATPSTFIPSVFTTPAGFGTAIADLPGDYTVAAGTLVVTAPATAASITPSTIGRTNFQIGFSYHFKGMDGFFLPMSTATTALKVYYINSVDATIAARGGANAPASGVGTLGSITTTGGGTTATVIVQVANQ